MIDNTTSNLIKNEKNDVTKGYIAGFFDAEGMIRIEDSGSSIVSIKQTSREVLDQINNLFVGTVSSYIPKKANHKISFRLNISRDEQIRFLEYLLPNLIEKRRQAELMLYYLREIKPNRRYYFKLSEIQKHHRGWLSAELKRLKHDNVEIVNDDDLIQNNKKDCGQTTLFDHYKETDSVNENDKDTKENTIKDIDSIIIDMSDDAFVGYITGFFDGEGYIGISRGKRDSYIMRIAVTNSNFKILSLYSKYYKGKIRPKTCEYKENHKKLWLWELFDNDAYVFLKKIFPFSKVKKNQIYYAMKFQEFHNSIRIINTNEKKKKAEYYRLKLHELKKINEVRGIESRKDPIINNEISLEKLWLGNDNDNI
jgi:hypothetical protein